MRKALPVIILCILLVAGCAHTPGGVMQSPITVSPSPSTAAVGYCLTFWPDITEEKLISYNQAVAPVTNSQQAVRQAMQKLAGNAPQACNRVLPPAVKVLSVVQIQDIAIVNLSNEFIDLRVLQYNPRMYSTAAIVNTLTSIKGIQYVLIRVEGKDFILGDRPMGPMGRFDTSLSTVYSTFYDLTTAQYGEFPISEKFNTILYFLSRDKKHLIPEVRQINPLDKAYYATVLDELLRGPSNTELSPILGSGLSISTVALNDTGEVLNISVYDSGQNLEKLKSTFVQRAIYLALSPYAQNMTNIQVQYYRNTGLVTTLTLKKSALFQGAETDTSVLGELVDFYVSSDYPDRQTEVKYALKAGAEDNKRFQVAKLLYNSAYLAYNSNQSRFLLGSDFVDNTVISQLLQLGDAYDQVRVKLDGNIAVADFSSLAWKVLRSFDERQAHVFVYSVVNTLTDTTNVTSVQFLSNGKKQGNLAGNLSVRYPLLRVPSIILD